METATLNLPLRSVDAIVRDVADLLLPDKRIAPSAAAARYLRNDRGAWDPSLAPEMAEPLDMLAERRYTGIVFIGPARSSKTMSLVLGSVAYIVTTSPGDTSIIGMSEAATRKFSRTELDRVIRHSPHIAARLSPRARDDSAFSKFFRSGIALTLGWPAVSQLASSTLRYVILTDYDRPENRDDVDGEGPLWDLAQKRTETYMSRGKCIAESSPGEEIEDPSWKASTPHEAPPAKGILSLYNRGTRARRYWPCKHCGHFFEAKPGVEAFRLPPFEELENLLKTESAAKLAKQFAHVYCPACGGQHDMSDRPAMKRGGIWLHEGDTLVDGRRDESGRRLSGIASFWLGGVAATYQRWDSSLAAYLDAVATYSRTGDETALKGRTAMDFAAPYLPRARMRRASAEQFRDRLEQWDRGTIPGGVRFLTAAVDVQARRFAVHVMGWGVGLESWLIDRFSIELSERKDDGRALAVDPASYLEDWAAIELQVAQRAYPVTGAQGVTLTPRLTLVDSGGQEGVTARAYDFWRGLARRGLGTKIQLLKGESRPNAARVHKAYPDGRGRSDRTAGARGDVPVLLINTSAMKDTIAGDLAREQPGPGYVHFADWCDAALWDELTAEERSARGWERRGRTPNEGWDLHVYNRAACVVLNAEAIDWNRPPYWATEPKTQKAAESRIKGSTLAQLGAELNAGTSHASRF